MPSCLWLARTMPFALTSGDRIYTAKLVAALASRGVAITYAGLAGTEAPTPAAGVTWHIVPGQARGQVASVFSTMPLVAARHATPEYRVAVDQLLRQQAWDTVVIDQYGMGWVLDRVRALQPGRPVLVFIGHDHEEGVTRQQWREAGLATPTGLYLLQNYLKTRRMERRTARACDVITAVSDADVGCFQQIAPEARVILLPPAYDGVRLAQREITASTPRAGVMFGSYRWSAKQANLALFLDHTYPKLRDAKIGLDVVGDMEEDQRRTLQARYGAAQFTGFVADPTPYLNARLAIIGEPIGGGFKVKLLYYIFNRLPMVTLEACAAGLPDSVLRHLLLVPDLESLASSVESVIDDFATLNRMQNGAFAAAEQSFNWADRAETLQATIQAAGRRRDVQPAGASRKTEPAENA